MKQVSGKFVLRIPPALHSNLSFESHKRGLSLNQYCLEILESRFKKASAGLSSLLPHSKKISTKLHQKFGATFLGIIFFGSRVTGQSTENSDLDLLIVLDDSVLLKRSLYQWWDEQHFESPYPVNPHFVKLPSEVRQAGGIWLEAASSGKIFLDPKKKLSGFIKKLLEAIEKDYVQRAWSHGHPYWIWKSHEKQITH